MYTSLDNLKSSMMREQMLQETTAMDRNATKR